MGLGLAAVAFTILPAALAAGPAITLENPLGDCKDLGCPAAAVADFLFTIAIPISGILILWGGFQMMTAAGNSERISQGKKTILWTVIGFAIVLIAGSVAKLIQNFFGVAPQ